LRPYSPQNPKTLISHKVLKDPSMCILQSLVGIVYGWDYDGIWSSSIPQLSFLINGNILGRCFRSCSSSTDPRISPLTVEYECPRLSLLTITLVLRTNKKEPESYLIIPCCSIQANAYLKHSTFLKVKSPREPKLRRTDAKSAHCTPTGGENRHSRNSTTSVLTATTLIYALGAGITAAAGTRLALQLILAKRFKFYSFQLQTDRPVLLFLVTTSLCQDWVICAPAAFLRCSSRFSGSFSGIEP
jgi:hypothetical protein